MGVRPVESYNILHLVSCSIIVIWKFFQIFYLFIFRERGRETSMYERNIDQLPLAHPQPETWLATQACALTRNQTGDLSVCRLVLNPLSHTSKSVILKFLIIYELDVPPFHFVLSSANYVAGPVHVYSNIPLQFYFSFPDNSVKHFFMSYLVICVFPLRSVYSSLLPSFLLTHIIKLNLFLNSTFKVHLHCCATNPQDSLYLIKLMPCTH